MKAKAAVANMRMWLPFLGFRHFHRRAATPLTLASFCEGSGVGGEGGCCDTHTRSLFLSLS